MYVIGDVFYIKWRDVSIALTLWTQKMRLNETLPIVSGSHVRANNLRSRIGE